VSETWHWPAATVTRVVDGDSFLALVTRDVRLMIDVQDIGFHGAVGPLELLIPIRFPVRLRLNRVNCPAVSTAAGRLAAATVAALMAAPGQLVNIDTVGPYKYGDAWMAEVTLVDGRNVSDELVRLGVAVFWDGKGPRPGG
jgi:endonuclease YncB( thermonuclease family)